MALTSTIITPTIANIYVSNGSNAVTTMYFCNTGSIPILFNVYAVPKNYQPGIQTLIYYNVPLTSHDTYVVESEKLILDDGDTIRASIVDPSSIASIGLAQTLWGAIDKISAAIWAPDRNEYVIVGKSGKVATSPTGESWTYQPGLINITWPDSVDATGVVRMIGKKYIVVGQQGWMGISTDGIAWTNATGISSLPDWGSNDINAIATNNSISIAVGNSARIATSIDGQSWDYQPSLSGTTWQQTDVTTVMWDGTTFIIGGEGGIMAKTTDGATWTIIDDLQNNVAWGQSTRVTTIVFSGSLATGYLALSLDNNKAATSYDAVTWNYNPGLAQAGSLSILGSGGATFRVGYGFYVIGSSSDIFVYDGTQWTVSHTLNNLPWNSVAGSCLIWNNARSEFMAVGYGARVATSSNGEDWNYYTDGIVTGISLPDVVVTVSTIGI